MLLNKFAGIVFILLGFALSSCEQNKVLSQVDDNRGEPLVDVLNQPWRFADYQGKWIIVNYWASWCKPCIAEIPELEAFYLAHKDTDAIVVGINYDFVSQEETAKIAAHYAITYPVLTSQPDPAITMGTKPITVLPTTLIINPQGFVVAELIGEQSLQTLEKAISP